MAQDDPHGHQDTTASNEPPATVTYILSPGDNDNDGSWTWTGSPVDTDASKGMEVTANVHGEERGSAGGSHANVGRSKGKRSAADVAAADAANDHLSKGKSSAADDGAGAGDRALIITERERRKRMKNMFSSLHAFLPHIPEKSDKATIVGEAIGYIRVLEDKVAMRKQELVLARQAAAAEVRASSSSAPSHPAQGAAMSLVVPHGRGQLPQQQQQRPAAAMTPPPQLTAAPVGFQTWWGPNVVLSVSDDDAYINLCAPRRAGVLTLVLSVLDKHRIDVVTTHVASDGVRSMFTIHARVNEANGENPASEEIYKLAVSEIMDWLLN
ncbi:transcription factor bHLH95-like [Phragmites australis]|uniref:transcription factor bHLH95-like n=1 Tax=Phragmites australis TaxID=29695 RepID=UPI002D790775|nr:transcription factor bHLH95-like [Phragmites australis]